jgi:quercetin dioxygenase-like cupin family protein
MNFGFRAALIATAITVMLLQLMVKVPDASASGPDARTAEDYESVERLLDTTRTIAGEKLVFPGGTPAAVEASIIRLRPGESTGAHTHDEILIAHILKGTLTVSYQGLGEKTFTAGDTFAEAMAIPHNGQNRGTEDVEILAIFVGRADRETGG